VAIQFAVGGQPSQSAVLILRPGQTIRPFGLPKGRTHGAFSGFTWGLPFGWLGGGMATIFVFQTPDSDGAWPGDPEVVFHRQRMKIYAPADYPGTIYNWPMRFPWPNALLGSNSTPQGGKPQLAITQPTRVSMRLRMTSLANPADMRIIMQSTNEFEDNNGAVATTASYQDVTWGSFTAAGGAAPTTYPVQQIESNVARLSADDGKFVLVDLSGGTLAAQYVDVVRWGRL
jgi:hypothetical protein